MDHGGTKKRRQNGERAAYHGSRVTSHESRFLQLALVVPPALPRPALVLADGLVLHQASHEGGDVGLVAALALLHFPGLAGGKNGGLGSLLELHVLEMRDE